MSSLNMEEVKGVINEQMGKWGSLTQELEPKTQKWSFGAGYQRTKMVEEQLLAIIRCIMQAKMIWANLLTNWVGWDQT